MSRKAFEVGIQRAYYVLWVLFFCGLIVGMSEDASRNGALSGDITQLLLTFAGAVLVIGVAIPWLLMRAVRWIYSGVVNATE